jgi:hypothetical protein
MALALGNLLEPWLHTLGQPSRARKAQGSFHQGQKHHGERIVQEAIYEAKQGKRRRMIVKLDMDSAYDSPMRGCLSDIAGFHEWGTLFPLTRKSFSAQKEVSTSHTKNPYQINHFQDNKMKDLLFSYYDTSYFTDLGLTERLSQALLEFAQGLVQERLIRLIRLPRRRAFGHY